MAIAILQGAAGNTPVIPQTALWANRAAFQHGGLVRFTDFGGGQSANGGGTYCFWNGSRFKPENNIAMLDRIDSQNDAPAGASGYNLNQNAAPILAAQIGLYDAIDFFGTPFKNGIAETATYQLRLGSSFTTADALIAQFTLTGGEVSGGLPFRIKRTGSNTFIREGSGNAQNSFGGPSSLTAPVTVTLSGADAFDTTAMKFSMWVSMSGSTEIASLRGFKAVLEATDS